MLLGKMPVSGKSRTSIAMGRDSGGTSQENYENFGSLEGT